MRDALGKAVITTLLPTSGESQDRKLRSIERDLTSHPTGGAAMRVRRLTMKNFRGIKQGVVDFPGHTLLVGGNNVGKSTVCEALELVLSPERLLRRPIIDEHDFYRGHYVPAAVEVPEGTDPDSDEWAEAEIAAIARAVEEATIRIDVILVDLSEEAERRFAGSLRRWDDEHGTFVDEEEDAAPERADAPDTVWAFQVAFIGRYNAEEDDFEGATFLTHPRRTLEEGDEERIGGGLMYFTREHKRLCGFVFLRALRTGSRALSLQKGSLLDTILRLSGESATEMWGKTLSALRDLDPAIGDIPQLTRIQSEIQQRARQFVGLSAGEGATAFFASDLTRETLREFVRLFVATERSDFLLPFQRHGTGTVNVLVFALLTFIAEMKRARSVIFVMEEPEIALPPHTQRRIAQFVLKEMGQAIVTSHSPYVIEQFDSSAIVVVTRSSDGEFKGSPLDAGRDLRRMFRTQRRQFAEAVLARAVLVVEGSTELILCHAVSTALERFLAPETYMHLDLAGVTMFDAGSDREVPRYGPVFAAMNKFAFAFCDRQKKPWPAAETTRLASYDAFTELSYDGIEDLLVAEVAEAALRRFLELVGNRDDYPQTMKYNAGMGEAEVNALAREVLIARKGDAYGYASLLISCCQSREELPASIVAVLLKLHETLYPTPETHDVDGEQGMEEP